MGFAILCNLLLHYCRSGEVNNLTGYNGEYMEKLVECIPLADDAVYDTDARVRYDCTNRILLKWWKYIRELIEQFRKNQEDAKQQLSEQLGGNTPIPLGKGKPAAGKFRHDRDAEELEKTIIQQVVAEETGRIALEKTDSFEEGSNPGVTHDNTYEGSGYTSIEEDMNRILTGMAEELVEAQMEEELTAELQEEADRIEYGNAHKGTHSMIFEGNSRRMLKYQKAKAKLVEYNVNKEEYPDFKLNSNDLSFSSTYILSRYRHRYFR